MFADSPGPNSIAIFSIEFESSVTDFPLMSRSPVVLEKLVPGYCIIIDTTAGKIITL
jgi:hypothetical protein